jgi:hypothetical protein
MCIEEVHNLYSLQNSVRIIKLRRTKWAGNVQNMEENEVDAVSLGETEGRRPLGRAT